MILSFILSMPNNNSWNNKWSGEENLYVITRSFLKINSAQAQEILDKGYFYYNFGDGWGSRISVKQVTSHEAAKLRKKSQGFCGYDWMVDEIIQHGEILGPQRRPKKVGTS